MRLKEVYSILVCKYNWGEMVFVERTELDHYPSHEEIIAAVNACVRYENYHTDARVELKYIIDEQ